jgi:hypothetical protein
MLDAGSGGFFLHQEVNIFAVRKQDTRIELMIFILVPTGG